MLPKRLLVGPPVALIWVAAFVTPGRAGAAMFWLCSAVILVVAVKEFFGMTAAMGCVGQPRLTTAFGLLFLTSAFLKFVWANRVFGYCAVVMASVPNDATDPIAFPRAAQAAELNIRAAMNFNRGLRSMYFALAALAWLLGPLALVIATFAAAWMIWAREFSSTPRNVLLGD